MTVAMDATAMMTRKSDDSGSTLKLSLPKKMVLKRMSSMLPLLNVFTARAIVEMEARPMRAVAVHTL
jgi:hypothetical protein